MAKHSVEFVEVEDLFEIANGMLPMSIVAPDAHQAIRLYVKWRFPDVNAELINVNNNLEMSTYGMSTPVLSETFRVRREDREPELVVISATPSLALAVV